MWQTMIRYAATGLGAGYSPVAPGTAGSLVGMGMAWILAPLEGWIFAVTIGAGIALACWVAEQARSLFGVGDPPEIVIDEIIACPIVMYGFDWTWQTALVGFLAFRLFDIWKPWPARFMERLPGGFGIVADDVVAGGYAWCVVWLLVTYGTR